MVINFSSRPWMYKSLSGKWWRRGSRRMMTYDDDVGARCQALCLNNSHDFDLLIWLDWFDSTCSLFQVLHWLWLVRGRLQSFIGSSSTAFQAHHDQFPWHHQHHWLASPSSRHAAYIWIQRWYTYAAAFDALFLGPYLSIYLPLHRDALRAISASPGALQGLAGQLYYVLIMLICCTLGAMWEPCLCGTPLEPVSEGSCVFLFRLEKQGFLYLFFPLCQTNRVCVLWRQCFWWFSVPHWMHPRVFAKWRVLNFLFLNARILLLVQSVSKSGRG
jgi:hypothetical protein